MRTVRSKNGRIRNFLITRAGVVSCAFEGVRVLERLQGTKKKYKQVLLPIRGTYRWYYVHRLMGFTWLPAPHSILLRIIDHRDGNSLNNRIENLRFITTTANNLNRACFGLVETDAGWAPRILGYTHSRYATPDQELASSLRLKLVESYIRFNTRYPEKGSEFPHSSIHYY